MRDITHQLLIFSGRDDGGRALNVRLEFGLGIMQEQVSRIFENATSKGKCKINTPIISYCIYFLLLLELVSSKLNLLKSIKDYS